MTSPLNVFKVDTLENYYHCSGQRPQLSWKSWLLATSLLLLGSNSSAYGQPIHSLSLDSVSGLHSAGTLYTSQEIIFHIRLTNISNDGVVELWHAFEVYSPSGAEWLWTAGEFADAVALTVFELQMEFPSGVTGSGSDTIGFYGSAGPSSCGIPPDFDEVSMRVSIGPIDTTFVGHDICLDSVHFESPVPWFSGQWNWELGGCDVVYDTATPGWDGPHCFTLVNPPCSIAMTGDVNISGQLTSADIIYLVNYTFKGGGDPLPCAAAADVNCDGAVTSADIIFSVNHIFKTGPAPCNACALIWSGVWSCP